MPVIAVVRVAGAQVEQLDQVDQPLTQRGQEFGEQPSEYGVVGRGHDGRAQGDVGVDELGGAAVRGLAAFGHRIVERGEVFLRAALCGQLCGFDLDEHADFVDVGDGRPAQPGGPVLRGLGGDDEDPGALARLHQARSGEGAQGFAHGGAAHPQRLGQGGLGGESGADRPVASDDLVAQVLGGLFDQRAGTEGAEWHLLGPGLVTAGRLAGRSVMPAEEAAV